MRRSLDASFGGSGPGQMRNQRLDPIVQQPKTPRRGHENRSPSPNGGYGDKMGSPDLHKKMYLHPPKPRKNVFVPPAVLTSLSHIAGSMRGMDWVQLYHSLDVLLRYFIPCEAFTLYIVEERGKYLRKVSPYLEHFPPDLRGSVVDAVADSTLQGSAAITSEACSLPSQSKYATDWATHETTSLTPKPGPVTLDEVTDGRVLSYPPEDWDTNEENLTPGTGGPKVSKVHNCIAWPLKFGTPKGDAEDPYLEYSSADSNLNGADETIFGVIKLTNRLAEKAPQGKQLAIARLAKSRSNPREGSVKHCPFADRDYEFMSSLTELLKALYFAVDPVTFSNGSQERSLEMGQQAAASGGEPINAPQQSVPQAGSRTLDMGGGGMFGVLGNAFAKSVQHRKRQAELPEVVARPTLAVTSDSAESIRNAPGWLHKEWLDEDLEAVDGGDRQAADRRLGGISLLATWTLKQDMQLDPYCAICRFQLRLRRTTRLRLGQAEEVWRICPAFFCVAPDSVTQQYSAFLTEYLQYGETYIVSVRAGSAERWSEWSEASEDIKFEAVPLVPKEPRQYLSVNILPANGEDQKPKDHFRTKEYVVNFVWEAFASFDPRTPLPIEYCIEAWQRIDENGAASEEMLKKVREVRGRERDETNRPEHSTVDWINCRRKVILHKTSSAIAGQKVEESIDFRNTSLVPGSSAFFSVKARYMSLPGSFDWSTEMLFTRDPIPSPVVYPALPVPLPLMSIDYKEAVQAQIGPYIICKWPFNHPATFCPAAGSGWSKGPFQIETHPSAFPLPYRLQYRVLKDDGNLEKGENLLQWSRWRELRTYEFIKRSAMKNQPSQRRAARESGGGRAPRAQIGNGGGDELDAPMSASIGDDEPGAPSAEVTSAELASDVLDAESDGEGCLDLDCDPTGILGEDWAMMISGLDESNKGGWGVLIQLRWISCRIEGVVSQPSAPLCTQVDTLPAAPMAALHVLNCSSSSDRGQNIAAAKAIEKQPGQAQPIIEEEPPGMDGDYTTTAIPARGTEKVIHELRNVVHLSWLMLRDSPSFALVQHFEVRYREVPPGVEPENCDWRILPLVPLNHATEISSSSATSPREDSPYATLTYTLTSFPFLRFHRYVFSMRLRSKEHPSEWSAASNPLGSVLPVLMPPSRPLPGLALPGWSAPAASTTPELLDARVSCGDPHDASTWHVELRWYPFCLTDNGENEFPALPSLPVEYQIKYYVVSKNPAAADIAPAVNDSKAADALARQREEAHVCMEGWVELRDTIASCSIKRSRLPPLGATIRLFLACRCPVLSGPHWSKDAISIDVVLPRQAELPLPMPKQLSWIELQEAGLPMDLSEEIPGTAGETLHEQHFNQGGIWAVLRIPHCPTEFMIAGETGVAADRNLFVFNRQALNKLLAGGRSKDSGHYVLQYRSHKMDTDSHPGAGANLEDTKWKTVGTITRLRDDSEESLYMVSGFEEAEKRAAEGHVEWAIFRLASFAQSHYGYTSPPMCISTLPAPSLPRTTVKWHDSPLLDGCHVSIHSTCCRLAQSYQLRFRVSSSDPNSKDSWKICEVQHLQPNSLGDGKDFQVEAVVPIDLLEYHQEYCFGLRCASPLRWSYWSQDSPPVRLSLEHHGMMPMSKIEQEKKAPAEGFKGLEVTLLGCEERHNYRCPAVDITWPQLTFPEGVWGPDTPSPSPKLTIEYRVRLRQCVAKHNERVALRQVLCELGVERRDSTAPAEQVPVISPDPDISVKDIALRGYQFDCTKFPDSKLDFSPWQTVTVIPALAPGREGTAECSYALTFLEKDTVYEVAVDWRWRRLGDAFWMPAYAAVRFDTHPPMPAPPCLRPLSIPIEAWDISSQISRLCSQEFVVFTWPFARPPAGMLSPAPLGKQLASASVTDVLSYGDYSVQCRQNPAKAPNAVWTTCEANFFLLNEKPLCIVKEPWGSTPTAGRTSPSEDWVPKPIDTPKPAQFAIGFDELEFRVVRNGDCEVSTATICAVDPVPPPKNIQCKLKLMPPHSTLIYCVRFSGSEVFGAQTVPRAYQICLTEIDGDTRFERPVEIPLERRPEFFVGLRSDVAFLGDKKDPEDRDLLGPEFLGAQGGGEGPQRLAPLEFEHVFSFKELRYGAQYEIAVRWVSPWRATEWSKPEKIKVNFSCPEASIPKTVLALQQMEPLQLPADLAGDDFLRPMVSDCVQLSWAPFKVPLWGGGQMEYKIEQRSQLRDDAKDADQVAWQVAGFILTDIDMSNGCGIDEADRKDKLEDQRVFYKVQELAPSTRYQFRVSARLFFHPKAGFAEEWSEPIESDWYRAAIMAPSPDAPVESVAPDPPPQEMLEDNTVLISFPYLPIREDERPVNAPPPPAPWILQFRGANPGPQDPWHSIECTPLDESRFVVNDRRLAGVSTEGVVFRLWRCHKPDGGDKHFPDDDDKIRYFGGIVSRPSKPLSVQCPRFKKKPQANLAFGPPSKIVEGSEENGHSNLPLLLKVSWAVSVLKNEDFAPVRLNQIRYRLTHRPAMEAKDPPGGAEQEWKNLEPFEHVCTFANPNVFHEIPVMEPNFLLGCDYELAVRVGTNYRWGSWSPPVSFSLQVEPPKPPPRQKVQVEMLTLEDKTTFFKLSWPSFIPHKLSTVTEYRIRMMRQTRFRYADRLTEEMAARSQKSIAAQQKFHLVGSLRHNVLRKEGTVEQPSLEGDHTWEFIHDVAADAECGFSFVVDAKHEKCECHFDEEWSKTLESEEIVTPAMDENWFIPKQVPLAMPAGHDVPEFELAFPLILGHKAGQFQLKAPDNPYLMMYAPWRSNKEASQWPHRIEYCPYIPQRNPVRQLTPQDEDEREIIWYEPEVVEYFDESSLGQLQEQQKEEILADGLPVVPTLTVFTFVAGFDLSLWASEQARLGVQTDPGLDPEQMAQDGYVRIRVVREGGPESRQFPSVPSCPMRLRMPRPQFPPSFTPWFVSEKVHAVLWWSCNNILACEEDKNLDLSNQLHQIRMRRPLTEEDHGWIEAPVSQTRPVLPLLSERSGRQELHMFDIVPLLDDEHMAQPNKPESLHTQPLGPVKDEAVLTYQFSVRVSDGYRWSDWSDPTEPFCFAMEPKLAELNAAKSGVDFTAIKGPESSSVATPSESASPPEFWPHPALEDESAHQEVPLWLSVGKVAKRPESHGPSTKEVETDCLLNQYVVSWPNLSSHSYSRPDDAAKNIIRELAQSGLPPYSPAPMQYRLNLWVVGGTPSPDGEADRPPSTRERDCVLYRTYDLPPAAYPEDVDDDDAKRISSKMKALSWIVPYLPPDRVYQCTLEGRFRHLNIEWWTPLMRSKEWVSEKIPPPPAPKVLPIRELPTPEYRKLINRRHPGTNGLVAVQWPWLAEGKAIDAMKNSSHVLEYCESKYRPGLRDASAPRLSYNGEGVDDRPLGPWREAKATQIYFAHFGKGIVEYELPHEAQYEANWLPILVASGLYLDNSEDEATFVHLRWRYKAGPRDLALVPTELHFGTASGPIRTKVVGPEMAPEFHLDCPSRKGKVTAWVKWTAWAGSQRYQFSIRLLKKPTKKARRGGRKSMGRSNTTTVSESGDSESEADTGAAGDGETTGLEPVTGWIELPSITDGFSFSEHPPPDCDGARPPEDGLLADLKRVIPAREWNDLLFRYYDDRDEVFDMGPLHSRQTDGTESSATHNVAGSVAGSAAGGGGSRQPQRQSLPELSEDGPSGQGQEPARAGTTTPGGASSTTETTSVGGGTRKSKARGSASVDDSTGSALRKFRIQWGMMVEWRVRVCDECLWSNWSPTSAPAGIMPPMPYFTTPVNITFSRREPTIARIAWGICALPEEYRHLAPSMEYVVALITDSHTAKGILQASQGTSSQAQLRAKGIQLTEGTCGIISPLEPQEGEPVRAKYDPNELFSEGSERRVVGQFTMAEAKWIDLPGNEESRAVTGFEVTVSGLKPESVHRFVVRTRCATSGLDELDWRKTTVEATHPLRWSDPQYTNPVLTPMMPPPLLPPEPATIPDGRFARFLHTPCVLLKCALFRKARADDFDKDHPVVVDVRPTGGLDEDYEQVPLENSVYCEIDGYGPCRLVYNLPYLHVELRTRNVIMNEVSAACPSLFAVPPLVMEADKGPDVELVCKPCGNLFVQLTWQTRCLPGQAPVTAQLGVTRHAVDMKDAHLPSFQMERDMILEEIPANAVMAADDYKRIEDLALSSDPPSPYKKVEEQCPFICRHCFQPLCREVPNLDSLGEFGLARLKNLDKSLRAASITRKEVPSYRGWDDDQRHLRAAHKLEVDAKAEEERPTLEKAVDNYRSLHDPPKVCQCRDVVIRSVLPIDGDNLKYGITYRYMVRVQDRLTWCPWSGLCEPVFLNIPPPKPICPPMNPCKPVPPPAIVIQLVRRDVESDKSGVDPMSATLRLKWTQFEGTLKELEYRVLMWTLSPDQRKKALEKKPFDLKGRCTLPPIVGVQMVALDVQADGQPTMMEGDTRPLMGSELENSDAVPSTKPRGRVGDAAPPPGSVATAVRHGSDAPQVISHLKPFEPPPRANAVRRPGKLPKDKDGAPLEGAVREPTTDVDVALLEKGFCYVFGVEAKHSRGVCGNVGEWSAPLFSKAIEFAHAPKQLHVSVNARFGAVVWNHTVATENTKDKKIALHAPAVGHVEEHHDLPAAMGMFPAKDPWPLHTNPEKYVVRQKGGSVYSDRLKWGAPVKNDDPGPPERGPHHDEKRPL